MSDIYNYHFWKYSHEYKYILTSNFKIIWVYQGEDFFNTNTSLLEINISEPSGEQDLSDDELDDSSEGSDTEEANIPKSKSMLENELKKVEILHCSSRFIQSYQNLHPEYRGVGVGVRGL